MRVFFDTSSLVKKYIAEPGGDEVDRAVEEADGIVVSFVYIIEVVGFMRRKFLEKQLTKSDVNSMRKRVFEDYAGFEEIAFSGEVQQKAVEFAEKYPLKSLDAIQLASAAVVAPQRFVTSDKQLYKYAQLEIDDVQLI